MKSRDNIDDASEGERKCCSNRDIISNNNKARKMKHKEMTRRQSWGWTKDFIIRMKCDCERKLYTDRNRK